MVHCFSGNEKKKNKHVFHTYEGSKCTVIPLFRKIIFIIFQIRSATKKKKKKSDDQLYQPWFYSSHKLIYHFNRRWRMKKRRRRMRRSCRRSRYLKVLRSPTLDNCKLVQIKTLLMKLWQVCPQFWNEEHVSKSIRKTHLGFPLLIYFTTFVRKLHVIINNIIIIIITQFPFLQFGFDWKSQDLCLDLLKRTILKYINQRTFKVNFDTPMEISWMLILCGFQNKRTVIICLENRQTK